MITLSERQLQFFNEVLGPESPDCERLQIYRNTIFSNYQQALALTYPGIWNLLGEDCANQVALAYCSSRERLPQSGCLDDWGKDFPRFLGEIEALHHLPYLQSYAEYEWLKQEVLQAPAAPIFHPNELIALNPEEQENSAWAFLPYVRLFQSPYPIHQIENFLENPNAESLNLSAEPSFAMITRTPTETITLWVTNTVGQFISAMHEGKTIGTAHETTLAIDPHHDLSETLRLLFSYPLLMSKIAE